MVLSVLVRLCRWFISYLCNVAFEVAAVNQLSELLLIFIAIISIPQIECQKVLLIDGQKTATITTIITLINVIPFPVVPDYYGNCYQDQWLTFLSLPEKLPQTVISS